MTSAATIFTTCLSALPRDGFLRVLPAVFHGRASADGASGPGCLQQGQFIPAGQPLPVAVAGHGEGAQGHRAAEATGRVEPVEPAGEVTGGESVSRADRV